MSDSPSDQSSKKPPRSSRTQPRVAAIGEWTPESIKALQAFIPTLWNGLSSAAIKDEVSTRELDLAIFKNAHDEGGHLSHLHQMYFGECKYIPGPVPQTRLEFGISAGEEHTVCDVHFSLRALQLDLQNRVVSARGRRIVKGVVLSNVSKLSDEFRRVLSGALLCSTDPPGALGATIFERRTGFKGRSGYRMGRQTALILEPCNELAWIRTLMLLWADSDASLLPHDAWTASATWATSKVLKAREALRELDLERNRVLAQLHEREQSLAEALARAENEARAGLWRLLTSQDETLVRAVEDALQGLGFEVSNCDEALHPGDARKEDLRIRRSEAVGWEAIGEVKGYSRSPGKTSDIGKLQRYATSYALEKQRRPDHQFLFLNGSFELSPADRPRPLSGGEDDIDEFKASLGLVVPTTVLFLLCKAVEDGSVTPERARSLLASETGLLTAEHVKAAAANVPQ